MERLRAFVLAHRLDLALAALTLAFGLWRLAPGLGHPSIHNWDESAHQAATRGTFASFFRPHIYEKQLYPTPPNEWLNADVFLHKPTGPFWFGALAMHLIGVTPLALRLGSLLGALAAALGIALLLQRLGERLLGLAGAAAFLALPFGYELCQGYIFGDVTDCTLAGWITVAVVLLVLAVERQDARLATLAGVATGLAYLCKTALGLAPVGVAIAFGVLGALKLTPRLPWRALALYAAAVVLVAVPWNVYTAFAFPAVYRYEAAHTLGHLFSTEVRQWVRPWDAILNEINSTELDPLPPAAALVALGWAIWRSLRRREAATIAVTIWVLGTWIVLSVAKVKVPATAWGAVPGLVALLAILAADARRSAAAFGLLAGSLASGWLLKSWPALGSIARALPEWMEQSRSRPQLAVGVVIAATAAALLFVAGRVVQRVPKAARVGIPAVALAVLVSLGLELQAQAARAERLSHDAPIAPMREVGLALDRALPREAVIFLAVDHDPGCCFDVQDLMFWSGRSVFRREPDLATAARNGLHPYLVSGAAEPFAEVPGVPPHAAARAYDLLVPAPAPAPPREATALAIPGLDVLAWAAGPRDGDHDVWAFFVRPQSLPRLPVKLTKASGEVLEAIASLDEVADRRKLAGKPWVVVTAVGPPRSEVAKLELAGHEVPLR